MLVKKGFGGSRGWDAYALAEDAELSVRIYSKNYLLPVVASSVTWEQEPEKLNVDKAKDKMDAGNLYLISKIIKDKK